MEVVPAFVPQLVLMVAKQHVEDVRALVKTDAKAAVQMGVRRPVVEAVAAIVRDHAGTFVPVTVLQDVRQHAYIAVEMTVIVVALADAVKAVLVTAEVNVMARVLAVVALAVLVAVQEVHYLRLTHL